ncbi:MAG: hypothetical protein QM667_11370 [Asticcacaulis sp.]
MSNRYWPLTKSICACIIGAGTVAFGCILAMTLAGAADSIGDPEQMLSALVFLVSPSALIPFLFIFVCTVVPMLIIGLPAQYMLQKEGYTGYLYHALPAAAAGALSSLLLFNQWASAMTAGLCAAIGFMAGSVAWLIRRPDKDISDARS